MAVYLVKPSAEFKDEYLSFYQDWKDSQEDMVPWVIARDPGDFDDMLQFLNNNEQGINIPEGWVKDSTYWLVTEANRVVGAVNIRHQLNEKLFNAGGHIGYGIRPSDRQKGYATQLLSLALEKTKDLSINKVLVVCDADNTGSKKTILKNGGIQDTDYIEEDGNIVNRFWISI
ncbi:GNAT family N-acetyltransferase [Paenibacillus solani]|uniref:GCN5 family acetyltransferase n=1 Tax=Paenibacillus solani TaxID=1705565 RepID=A0A0M1P7A9_9BACL|nr:GNAT family N-acetyltransferase [Paenibacillus solani]KOR90220.1 GCN5 family acetyltransferase [Paenibacillus solani]